MRSKCWCGSSVPLPRSWSCARRFSRGRSRTEVAMRKRSRAALAPAVIAVAAIAGAAGYRAQESGPGRRLDELSRGRPAAASHFPVDGALAAASQAAAEARWTEGSQARQMELFLQAAVESEALEAHRAQSRKAPARTGRGGGG